MSIYSLFEARLDAEKISKKRPSSRRASIVLADNPHGDPLLGIQYTCDFRSEEETGTSKMAETFTRTADHDSFFAQEYLLKENNLGLLSAIRQADLVLETEEAIVFSAEINSYNVPQEIADGLRYVRDADRWSDGRFDLERKHRNKSVPELKAELKNRGIKGYSKLNRDALLKALTDDDYTKLHGDTVEEVFSQPGWFHYGSLLIFEKKDGLFGEVLRKLVEAAQAGYLVVGGGGIGAFGSAFTLFDSRDLTEESKERITAANIWYREQMELLKPVAEVVQQGPMKKSWGSAYYFLGNPGTHGGEIKYWLNGSSVKFPNGRNDQPSGWYSLQELLDEKYMEDAARRSDDSFKRFTPQGSYRAEMLTDEQAEAELKSRGLRWASKPMAED